MRARTSPDLRYILDRLNAGWRREAACQGEERLFLSDRALGMRKNDGSPTLTLALAIGGGCEIRTECLAEARPRRPRPALRCDQAPERDRPR